MRARRGSAVLLRVVVINSSTLGLWTMTTTLTKGQKQMEKALLSHAHKKHICEDRVLLLSQLVLRAENSGCFYWTHKRGTHEQKTGKPTLGFLFFLRYLILSTSSQQNISQFNIDSISRSQASDKTHPRPGSYNMEYETITTSTCDFPTFHLQPLSALRRGMLVGVTLKETGFHRVPVPCLS